MITKLSVQQRLCQAVKLTGQNQEFQQKLLSAEYHYVAGDLFRANRLLTEMGFREEMPISAHAKTMPGATHLYRPSTPLFDWKPFKAPCEVDHTPYQRSGGICQKCKRVYFRGTDIQE
jgi:hypothetical protein